MAAEGFDAQAAKQWAKQATWLGLQVVRSFLSSTNTEQAFVEFKAHYEFRGQKQVLQELSEFKKLMGRWYYTAGASV